MTLERAYYHCESCRTGFCPRDRTLGIDETTLSPAATRMTAAAAARVSFKEASTLLDELAGLALDPKQVERTAEALGRAISADERQAVEPEAHHRQDHPAVEAHRRSHAFPAEATHVQGHARSGRAHPAQLPASGVVRAAVSGVCRLGEGCSHRRGWRHN